jgi:hypothetical protein
MGQVQQPVSASANPTQWSMDLIFLTLSNPMRRKSLLSLAHKGPQTADQLHGGPKYALSTRIKQLSALCEAGLVQKSDNPSDRRKPLYALSPAVPLTKTDAGIFIDFGFCTLRIE